MTAKESGGTWRSDENVMSCILQGSPDSASENGEMLRYVHYISISCKIESTFRYIIHEAHGKKNEMTSEKSLSSLEYGDVARGNH